jgi:hypothetical protein
MNKSQMEQRYSVAIRGLESANIRWSKESQEGESRAVSAGEIGDFTVLVTLATNARYKRSQTIELTITETNGNTPETVIEKSRFWAPKPQ